MSQVLNELANISNRNENYKDMYKNVLKERKTLSSVWKETGLLEGLKGQARLNMAQILENQKRELIREANNTSDITGFQNIALPLVRRVFGGLLANKLVSVQPLSLPSGLVFYLDYKYASGKSSGFGKSGNQNLQWESGDSIYGNPIGKQLQTTGALATGGHYDLMNSYTRQEVTCSLGYGVSGSTWAGACTSGAVTNWADVNYDPDLSASMATNIYYYTVTLTGLTNVDQDAYKNFALSGTADSQWSNVKALYKRHTTLTFPSGTATLKFFYSGSTPILSGSSGSLQLCYVKTAAQSVGSEGSVFNPDFESDFISDMIPEIDININAVNIQAHGRKLKAKWTPELAQDINAYQSLDAEAELTTILSEQIAMDIDAEILQGLLNAAGLTYYWSRNPGQYINKETGVQTPGPSFTGNQIEWYWSLIERINDMANQIQKRTLRGAANFLVVSPEVATIFESLLLFKPVISFEQDDMQFTVGAEKIGTLNSRYQVYKTVYMPKNTILMGYKGNSYLEQGSCYSPYIPLIVSPTIYDPLDFTPRKAVMSRYAFTIINKSFYGKLYIRDL